MICHEFKGGIGTASRVVADDARRLHGRRARPGELRPARAGCGSTASRSARRSRSTEVPARTDHEDDADAPPAAAPPPGRARSSSSSRPTRRCCPTSASGSAQRAGLGIARMGGTGGHTRAATCSSCFATGNRLRCRQRRSRATRASPSTSGRSNDHVDRRAVRRRRSRRPRRRSSTPSSPRETMTGRDGDHRARAAPRPAARDDGPVRQAGPGTAPGLTVAGGERSSDQAGGRGRHPGDPGDPRRARRTTARSSSPTSSGRTSGTCCGPDAPGSRIEDGRGGRRVRRRRSTPAGRSTWRTCSCRPDRIGPGHRPAAARTRSSATQPGRTTFASDDPRALADLRPRRDAAWWASTCHVEGHGGPAARAAGRRCSTRDASLDELAVD